MPILGLTDRGAAFPRIGILRKGGPKVSDRQPGADLKDHFRFDTDDPQALADFTASYGDKPNGIEVMFHYRTAAENFDAWQEHHSAGALKHRCDGQTCVLWLDKDGVYQHDPIPCPSIALKANDPNIDKKHLCRPVGRLKVIIPALRRMAYVLVATTSINDILELQGNLEAAEAMRGDLRGIRFVLSRRPRQVSTPGSDGKRARREKWLLSIEPAPDWVRLQLTAAQQAALPSPVLALPAPNGDGASYVDPETSEIFDGDEEASDPELDTIDQMSVARRNATTPDLATISGPASRVNQWFTDDGSPRLQFFIGEGHRVLALGALAEAWFDIADEETITATGAWSIHPKVGTYLAASGIERIETPGKVSDTAQVP